MNEEEFRFQYEWFRCCSQVSAFELPREKVELLIHMTVLAIYYSQNSLPIATRNPPAVEVDETRIQPFQQKRGTLLATVPPC